MIKNQVIKAYEKLALAYDAMIDEKPHNAYYDRPNTLALLGNVNGKKILDAACGPGKYAEILMKSGADVVGLDISPKMIELAKERNPENGVFKVHDLTMPLDEYDNGSFDIILCALAMHYVEDWDAVMREFCRVLNFKGVLVISIEHPFFQYNHFKSKNYFKKEVVKEKWSGFGKPVEVHCYKRSLQDCLIPITSNGFFIDKVVEPLPTEEFKKRDRRHYKELMEFPAFMCIRAVKRN